MDSSLDMVPMIVLVGNRTPLRWCGALASRRGLLRRPTYLRHDAGQQFREAIVSSLDAHRRRWTCPGSVDS